MKRTVLFAAITLIFTTIYAQDSEKPDLKPKSGDLGLTFNINGLINNIAINSITDVNGNQALIFRRYINDDLSFRLGFGLTTTSQKFNTVDSVFTAGASLVEWDSTYKKTDIFFAPGIQKHFITGSRLDPYMGAELVIGALGRATMKSNKLTSDTVGSATLKIDGNMDGGFSFAVNLIAGFNYFFSHKIAIGAEYSWGFGSSTVGGEWQVVTIDEPASGTGTTKREEGLDITTTTGFAVGSTAGITLSYFFTRTKKAKKTGE